MSEIIFTPKYSTKLYFSTAAAVLVEIFLLGQIISGWDRSPINILSALFFGSLVALLPIKLIKRIAFDKESFTIEKFLWPAQTIQYTDLVAVEPTKIKTRNNSFVIEAMTNSRELRKILNGALRDANHRIESEINSQRGIDRKFASYRMPNPDMRKYKMRRQMKSENTRNKKGH